MDLNPRQQEAVDYGEGPLLIVAGAGSGKTKTLTSRLIKLLSAGVPPASIAAVTFTNKAAQEMQNRISSSANNESYTNKRIRKFETNSLFVDGKLPFIGTFHSFGARILKKEARSFKRSSAFSIFDDDDALSLLKETIKKLEFSFEKCPPPVVASDIAKVKNLLLGPEEILDERGLEVFRAYESALARNNAFDFDDLIEKVVWLWRKHPETLEKYRNKFRYLLVDEYQDVNPSQYELVRLLAGKHKNLSVVGDDSQAIYGWRFADFRNFLNFEKDWAGAKVVFLEQNYRSTANIITAASAVIKNNVFQKPKNLWTENRAGELIKVVKAGSAEEEAGFIAQRVNLLIGELADWNKNRKTQLTNQLINQSTSAILYRTNAQSRALEQALIQNNIPYRIFGGVKFYERKEIKDIIAGLRLAFNPKDGVSAERIRKTFPKETAKVLTGELPALGKKLAILELINFFLANSRYFDYLKQKFKNAEERRENINELIVFASEFTDLGEFLERVSLLQSTDLSTRNIDIPVPTGHLPKGEKYRNQPPTSNLQPPTSVNLMTIHLAKGLEFDSVFVAGVNEGLLPHQLSYGALQELEEERRLMYVAMTRAKRELYLSFYNLPSRFLYEIPPELTEFINIHDDSEELPDEEEIYIE